MKCNVQWCETPAEDGGIYCAGHRKDCDRVAIEKACGAEPLPKGNRLMEFFTKLFKRESR